MVPVSLLLFNFNNMGSERMSKWPGKNDVLYSDHHSMPSCFVIVVLRQLKPYTMDKEAPVGLPHLSLKIIPSQRP